MSRWLRYLRGPFALLLSGGLALGPAGRSATAQDPEEQAWQAARARGTSDAFQAYLDSFPTGRHASEAFAAVVAAAKGFDLADVLGGEPAPGASTGAVFSSTRAIY